MYRDEKTMHMKDRQRMNEAVLRRELPKVHQCLGIGQKIAVAEHRALRLSGRTRGVNNGRKVTPLPRHRGRFGVCEGGKKCGKRTNAESALAQALEQRHRVCATDSEYRLCVLDKIGQLGLRVINIERQIDATRAQASEVNDQRFGRFIRLRKQSVTWPEPERQQMRGEPSRRVLYLALGPVPRALLKEDPVCIDKKAS